MLKMTTKMKLKQNLESALSREVYEMQKVDSTRFIGLLQDIHNLKDSYGIEMTLTTQGIEINARVRNSKNTSFRTDLIAVVCGNSEKNKNQTYVALINPGFLDSRIPLYDVMQKYSETK
jgi:hypothetical protein